jgi:hypothetical protein
MSLAGGAWNVSSQVGDYGVFWDPQLAVGCAWANLDHVGDVAAGASPCRADCRQSPDGAVGIVDLLALLLEWGVAAGGGPCDLDFDGEIGQNDMLALLADWGDCTQPAAAGGNVSSAPPVGIARSADLDGSGSVDQGDFEMLRVGWGPCQAPCPRDLDGDGRVSARDVMELFARWGREDRPEAITSPAAPGPASSAPPSAHPPR